MSCRLVRPLTLLGLVLVGEVAEAKEPYYFPTRVGDRLVFEMNSGGTVSEVVDEVTAAESKDGSVLVETRRTAGAGTGRTLTHDVSAKGVYHVAVDSKFLRSRMCVVRLPVKTGDTWPLKMTFAESEPAAGKQAEEADVTATATVVGTEEEVSVPAGRFKCIHVEATVEESGAVLRTSYWLAPGLGPVRATIELGESKDRLRTAQELSLKSYTPGKK